MDLATLPPWLSVLTGGGLVLVLSQYIFSRLINQVDSLAEKVAQLQISQAETSKRIDILDRIESHIDNANDRLTRLETMVKMGDH